MSETVDELRKQIDGLDNELITVLSQRMQIASRIGAQKKAAGLPARDESRWQRVIQRVLEQGRSLGLSPDLVKTVWEAIHKASVEIEEKQTL